MCPRVGGPATDRFVAHNIPLIGFNFSDIAKEWKRAGFGAKSAITFPAFGTNNLKKILASK
jgi:hypothetical protein